MVLGRSSEPKGEVIWAIVVPDTDRLIGIAEDRGESLTEKMAADLLRRELSRLNRSQPPYRRIARFIIRTEELPKTTTRKIRRPEVLRESGLLEPERTYRV
jgi:long-chain acyl-CoA synthetase